jgi:hypothetical protein
MWACLVTRTRERKQIFWLYFPQSHPFKDVLPNQISFSVLDPSSKSTNISLSDAGREEVSFWNVAVFWAAQVCRRPHSTVFFASLSSLHPCLRIHFILFYHFCLLSCHPCLLSLPSHLFLHPLFRIPLFSFFSSLSPPYSLSFLFWFICYHPWQETEMVPETSVIFNQLTRLVAREYFNNFSRRESFRSYILNEHYPSRWFGRCSSISSLPLSWPPCSPDLATQDDSLWDIIKGHLAARRYRNSDGLRKAV